jgi:predicted lipid-binding transport protein (Tim44 family)
MKIAKDKKLHLAAGAIAGLVGSVFCAGPFGMAGLPVFLAGVAIAGLAGVAKEVYDARTQGVVDYYDVAYTAAGGVVPALVMAVAL